MNLAFKKEVENWRKKPSVVPLHPTWPAHSHVTHYRKPEKVCPIGGERDARGARLQVRPLSSLPLLRFESRRAFRAPLLYFISPLCHSSTFIPSHWLPPHTKYIYYPAVCCRWAPLAGFPLLGRMQETRRRERKEEKEIRVSNSVRQPVRIVRLMVAKLSMTLINMHLS